MPEPAPKHPDSASARGSFPPGVIQHGTATSPTHARAWPAVPAFRIGHGYDLHRLEPPPPAGKGRPFVLGGVRIDHATGPVGHSDGDALAHAVTDALLGAIAQPDIGQLFPDTDPRHDNEDSSVYVIEAARRVAEFGWVVANLDCTVILERPKVGPVKDQVRANLAGWLGIPIARVNVKGKTHEKVDAVGEGRAIEVHAVVILQRPPVMESPQ